MKNRLEATFIIAMALLALLFIFGLTQNHTGPQANVFFKKTVDYMADYHKPAVYASQGNPYHYGEEDNATSESAYLPLVYVFFEFAGQLGNYSALTDYREVNIHDVANIGIAAGSMILFLFSAIYYLILYTGYKGRPLFKFLIPTMFLLSGIFIFSYERGNLIFLAALFSAFFVFNYKNENKYVRELAYILLVLASIIKVYPVFLGLLLLQDKNYKAIFRMTIYGLAGTFLPFLLFEGGFGNLPILLKNLSLNSKMYNVMFFPRFNFRYWFPFLLQWFPMSAFDKGLVESILSVLSYWLCILGLAASFFHKLRWKSVTQLLLVVVVFPVNSALYTGLYLLIGFVLFFSEEEHSRKDWLYLALIVAILNPFQLLLELNGRVSVINLTHLGANLSASLMLFLLTLESIKEYLRWRKERKSLPAEEPVLQSNDSIILS